MNNLSNQVVRFALFSLATVSTSCVAVAQTTELPRKQAISKSGVGIDSCEQEVRPIQRVKKPAKPIAADWTTMASTYTHDQDGQRVDQYALAVEPQSMERPDFVRSGFRSTRSSLQAGFNADHYHVTEQWGQPVQPYGEWRYPNRPFSVPYGQWGPQLPQVVVGGNQWNAFGQRGFNPGTPGNGNGNGNGNSNGNGNFGPGMNGPVQQGNMPGMGGPGGWPMGPGGNGNWIGNGPGNSAWSGQGGGAQGGFGVGPANVLPAGQDEYYPQSPTYQPMSGGGFQSPFRD